MKNVYFIVTLLFCLFAQGQNSPAIKIYLEDAETNQNIPDAKVTLEGFEIPAITGKYDKKEKYYYFAEIPTGYNTIMAYHKKYNEKGFQDTGGLPKELKLKLYDPLNVSYSFEKLEDSIYDERKKKNVKNIAHRNYYIEDPYKIVVKKNEDLSYNELKEYFNKLIIEFNFKIELVNPYWERNKIERNIYRIEQKVGYPIVSLNNSEVLTGEYIFPLSYGLNNFQIIFNKNYSKKLKEVCFIFRKIDGSKFKRFNDPIIKKLMKEKLSIHSIILNKKNSQSMSKLFSKDELKIKDELNKNFNVTNNIDSSKVFFYDNNLSKINKKSKLFKKKQPYLEFDELNSPMITPTFILIKNNDIDIPKYLPYIKNEYQKQNEISNQEESIGLGILDIYEYYSNKIK